MKKNYISDKKQKEFFDAVQNNNIQKLSKLLASDDEFNMNAFINEYETPLMCAAKEGFIQTVSLLIKFGAKLDIQNKEGNTAIMEVGHKIFIETVKSVQSGKINNYELIRNMESAFSMLLEAGSNLNIINHQNQPLSYLVGSNFGAHYILCNYMDKKFTPDPSPIAKSNNQKGL